MALVDNAWYVNFGDGSTTGYYVVAQWAALTTYDCGALRRQLATPAVNSERIFVVVTGHVASGAAEPTWVTTRGGKTTDATITWQEATGVAALNGDLTNTPTWNTIKNTVITLGQVIQNVAGTLILICTTAGTAGNGAEPSWAAYTTAGATTADNTATWTTLGSSFSAWAAPHARLTACLTTNWAQAGNSVYVGDNHAQTGSATVTVLGAGTVASPILIYCADRTGATPPTSSQLRTTATITTTGNSAINLSGNYYVYGITFSAGSGAVAASLSIFGALQIFENCSLQKLGTSATSSAIFPGGGYLRLINTTVKFGSTGDQINFSGGVVIWENTLTAIIGATFPTTLFNISVSGILIVRGVDLSNANTGIYTCSVGNVNARFINCKFPASATLGTPTAYESPIDSIISDSAATNYRNERYSYAGTQTTETTVVRTGGATDGTTPISWKIVDTANSKWLFPFISQPITIWNNSTAAITTLTLYGTTTGGGVPNNDDIWVEVEYLGSSATPQGSFQNTTKANNLAASVTTNNSSDGSTWGGGGAGNGFKIVVPSFTPGMKGPLNITIKVAKASTTYYIDPRPVIT